MGLINWVRGLRARYDASVKRAEADVEREKARYLDLVRQQDAAKGADSEPAVHPGRQDR